MTHLRKFTGYLKVMLNSNLSSNKFKSRENYTKKIHKNSSKQIPRKEQPHQLACSPRTKFRSLKSNSYFTNLQIISEIALNRLCFSIFGLRLAFSSTDGVFYNFCCRLIIINFELTFFPFISLLYSTLLY